MLLQMRLAPVEYRVHIDNWLGKTPAIPEAGEKHRLVGYLHQADARSNRNTLGIDFMETTTRKHGESLLERYKAQ